jgi:hypothetical protein
MLLRVLSAAIGSVMVALIVPDSISAQPLSPSRATSGAREAGVPSIDEMASEWLDVSELAHMPSLHNFHEMAACSPNLLGVNYNPGGQLFDWPVGPKWFRYITLPLVTLRIDGDIQESETCRWYPYQAVRRKSLDGLRIETKVRMIFEGPGILYEVRATNTSDKRREVNLAVTVPGDIEDAANGTAIVYRSKDPKLQMSHGFGDIEPHSAKDETEHIRMAHAFVQTPDHLSAERGEVVADWKPSLSPGESFTLQLIMAHSGGGSDIEASSVAATAIDWSKNFDRLWNESKDRWAKRWSDAFTPGNPHFSGHLPTLITSDEKIRDIYYRSVLTLLVLHRTNMKMCDRVFITSGERAKGVVFFWDTSMWSKVFALLEPKGMKEQLRLFLQCDPHRGPVCNLDDGSQWDGWYAANDMTIFRLVKDYVAVTGDEDFLDEKVGDRTVLEHMDTLATNWQQLQRDKSVMLADYGDNQNLLECAPAYVHRVPSFNAANVWMMRTMADLHDKRGNSARAEQLRKWADEFSNAVLGLYVPGDGVWCALHRDGKRVELRHCYDFVCVGSFMAEDLTPTMKQEMVNFVSQELWTDRWMRAMSLDDEAAKLSDRPDHGPMGAYDAWPALTARAMCMLGDWKRAIQFLRGTQAALYEGVYGQAHEYYGDDREGRNPPVRIAMRQACMRESVGGGAFAEMIIGTLFGFAPGFDQELTLYEPDVDRGFQGELRGVQYQGKLWDISSNPSGVRIHSEE